MPGKKACLFLHFQFVLTRGFFGGQRQQSETEGQKYQDTFVFVDVMFTVPQI